MRRDNPNNSEIREIFRRLDELEAGNPLESASVTNGRLRFIGGLLLIDAGGRLEVIGSLAGQGTFDWTGPMNLQGAQSVTGPTTFTGQVTVNGPWKFVGPGEITGNVDLKGILRLLSDLLVKSGGRIVIEGDAQIVLEQAGGVARMRMGASEIRGGDGIGLYSNAGPDIISTSVGLRVTGLPTIDSASVGVEPGTIWSNAQGFLYRAV